MIIRTLNGLLRNIDINSYTSDYEIYSLILLLKFNINLCNTNNNNNNYSLIINNIN